MNTETHQRLITNIGVITLLLIGLFYLKENVYPKLQKAFDLNSQMEFQK